MNKDKPTFELALDLADIQKTMVTEFKNVTDKYSAKLIAEHFARGYRIGDRVVPNGPGLQAIEKAFKEFIDSEKARNIMEKMTERLVQERMEQLVAERLFELLRRKANEKAWEILKANPRLTELKLTQLIEQKDNES